MYQTLNHKRSSWVLVISGVEVIGAEYCHVSTPQLLQLANTKPFFCQRFQGDSPKVAPVRASANLAPKYGLGFGAVRPLYLPIHSFRVPESDPLD